MNDNLPELRDIHLPDGVSIFPPAYGWYVLLFSCVLLWLLFRLYRIWRLHSRRLYALRLLADLDENDIKTSAIKISELLRRICVYRYSEAVSLSGRDWIDFLNKHTNRKLSPSAEELLLNAPYVKPDSKSIQREALPDLISYAQHWVGENL